MGRRKIQGPNTLDRWQAEPHDQHRALLLLAMQDPGSGRGLMGRSLMPVVTAIGKARGTLRQWERKRRWSERIEHHGSSAQAYAIELYRAHYMEHHGRRELPHVAALVSLPMTTAAPRGVETPTQERIVQRLIPPDPTAAVQEQVQQELDKKRADALKTNRAIRGIALEGLKAIQNGIKAATDKKFAKENPHVSPVRVTLGDVPRLQQVLRELSEEAARLENPEANLGTGAKIVDSVRVRMAKETGGNVLQAMREDVAELQAIMDAMLAPEISIHDLEAERQARVQVKPL